MTTGLLLLLIPIGTIYGPVELSRVVVGWGLAPKFILELVFMWLFYGLAMFSLILVIRRRMRRSKEGA